MADYRRIGEFKIRHKIRFRDGHIEEVRSPTKLRVELGDRDDIPHVMKVLKGIVDEMTKASMGASLVRFLGDLFTTDADDKSRMRRDAVYDVEYRIIALDTGRRVVKGQGRVRFEKAAPFLGDP